MTFHRFFDRTFKEFVFELTTITIGMLIALAINGWAESRRDRQLVEDARRTIAQEIAANTKELKGNVALAKETDERLAVCLQFANDMLATGKSSIQGFGLNAHFAEIGEAGWQTADRTGALSFMPYAEVQTYSRLYALQDTFVAEQRKLLDRLTEAVGIAMYGNPHKASREDLVAFRQNVIALRSELVVSQQLAEALLKQYKAAASK